MSCNICYTSEIEPSTTATGTCNSFIKCIDKNCSCRICVDCMESYINHCYGENLIPKCIDKCPYYITNIKNKVSDEVLEKYNMCVYNYFISQNESLKKEVSLMKVVEKLREEKRIFFQNNFPEAINLIIQIISKNKLKHISKNNKEAVKKEFKKSCLLSYCNGILDPNNRCIKCFQQFCNKCEKIQEKDHICKEEDIKSISLINLMVHCPGCKLPVEKSEGCDSITCSRCKTMFLYSTGKVGGHGSSNAELKLKEENIKLSLIYKDSYSEDIITMLDKIDNLRPIAKEKYFDDIIINIFKTEFENVKQNSKKLASRLEKYNIYQYQYKNYINILLDIENLHKSGGITLKKLQDIEKNFSILF